MIHGTDKTNKLRPEVLLSALGAALISACVTDPVYLGVTEQDEQEPFVCDDNCFIERTLNEEQVRDLFSEDATAPQVPAPQVPAPQVPAPVWHYPLEKSVHPSNLGLMTLHFEHQSSTDSVFEVRITSGESERRLYFPCFSAGARGCLYDVPELFWTEVASTFEGQAVTLTLRAANENGVSRSVDLPISFSPGSVFGGLYYWSRELRGVARVVFGGREAVPFIRLEDDENDEERCVGCHSVSRDGTTIALSQGSSSPGAGVSVNAAFEGALRVASVTDLETSIIEPDVDAPSDTGMMTLSSDGSRVVSAFDFKLELRNTSDGAVIDELGSQDGATPVFPEFHPEDGAIALTLSEQPNSEIGVARGSIAVIPMSAAGFGTPEIIVEETDELSHYYPSWSPDGAFIVFVSGPRGEESYDQPDSRLRLVEVATGAVHELENATGAVGLTSTWPKFAPFSQCKNGLEQCEPKDRLFFLSYSSKRPYGLVANAPGEAVRAQLWMSAVEAPDGTSDPSSVPFWVPYQAPDTSNHLGYWTTALRCNENIDCGFSQVCNDGECEVVVR